MKRAISLLMVAICLLCCISCSDESTNEVEYEEIQLSKFNYQRYLNIMLYLTDFSVSESSNGEIYSCVFHFETDGIGDNIYKDVEIEYRNYNNASWTEDTISEVSGLTTKIGSDGKSHVSYGAWTENKIVTPNTFANTTGLAILDVKGTVLVPVKQKH